MGQNCCPLWNVEDLQIRAQKGDRKSEIARRRLLGLFHLIAFGALSKETNFLLCGQKAPVLLYNCCFWLCPSTESAFWFIRKSARDLWSRLKEKREDGQLMTWLIKRVYTMTNTSSSKGVTILHVMWSSRYFAASTKQVDTRLAL